MKKFNKNEAINKIKIKQNKNTYIKKISIALSCLILLVIVMLFTFAKFESNQEFTLINGIIKTSRCEYSEGQVVFEKGYTGKEETFKPSDGCSGNYKLEVWGAQGGNADSTYTGGYGGYSVGTTNLDDNTTIYINTGGKGTVYTFQQNQELIANGGYNGGGYGHTNKSSWSYRLFASGGGATHIATKSGLLSSLENDKDKILIVAGGGGGGENQQNSSDGNYIRRMYGGSGGGYIGGNVGFGASVWGSCGTEDNSTYFVTGGTQDSGGNQYSCGVYSSLSGQFGQALYSPSTLTSDSAKNGGGGGYYGGIFGSGGSGYIGSQNLESRNNITKHMYCYNCKTSNESDVYTLSNGTSSCHNQTPTQDCAKENDGYTKITYLGKSSNNKYVVTFNANGGNLNPTSIEVTNGENYGDLPTPTRNNINFLGWYTEKYTGDKIDENSIVNLSSHQTLYAHWDYESNFYKLMKLVNNYNYDNPNDFMNDETIATSIINSSQAQDIMLADLSDENILVPAFVESTTAITKLNTSKTSLIKLGNNSTFMQKLKLSKKYSDTYVPMFLNNNTLTNSEKMQYGYPVYIFNNGTSNTSIWSNPQKTVGYVFGGYTVNGSASNGSTINVSMTAGDGACPWTRYYSSVTSNLSKYVRMAVDGYYTRDGVAGGSNAGLLENTTSDGYTSFTGLNYSTRNVTYGMISSNKSSGKATIGVNACSSYGTVTLRAYVYRWWVE